MTSCTDRVDGQPRGGEQGFVIGQQVAAIGEEPLEPAAFGQHHVHDQRIVQGLFDVVVVADAGEHDVHHRLTGLGSAAFEVAHGLAAQPANPVGERRLGGDAEVALLVLASGAAPTGFVAAQRGGGAGERLERGQILGDRGRRGAPAPQAAGSHGVAPVAGVPGQPVGAGDEAAVGLDGQLEVLLGRGPVAGGLGVEGGEQPGGGPPGRAVGGVEQARDQAFGGQVDLPGVDQLVGRQREDVEIAEVVERLADRRVIERVPAGLFLAAELVEDVEHRERGPGQLVVAVGLVRDPLHAGELATVGPDRGVVGDGRGALVEPGGLAQGGERCLRLGEDGTVVGEHAEDQVLARHGELRLIDGLVVRPAERLDEGRVDRRLGGQRFERDRALLVDPDGEDGAGLERLEQALGPHPREVAGFGRHELQEVTVEPWLLDVAEPGEVERDDQGPDRALGLVQRVGQHDPVAQRGDVRGAVVREPGQRLELVGQVLLDVFDEVADHGIVAGEAQPLRRPGEQLVGGQDDGIGGDVEQRSLDVVVVGERQPIEARGVGSVVEGPIIESLGQGLGEDEAELVQHPVGVQPGGAEPLRRRPDR